jgi:hypothetical protein
MRRRILAFSPIPLLGIALGLAYWKSPTPPKERPSSDTRRELDDLRSEISALKSDTAARLLLAARSVAPSEPSVTGNGPKEPSAALPGDPANPPVGAERSQQQIEADDAAAVAETAAFLGNTFEAERVDPAWSFQATRDATRALSTAAPPGSTLGKIECRTNLCRVESTHENLEAFKAYVDASYMSRERTIWNGGFTAMVTARSATGVTAVTFIAREGQGVPVADATER